MRHLIAAIALLAIACGGEERAPEPDRGPRPGFDQTPTCGSAFLYEVTETKPADSTYTDCPDGEGDMKPSAKSGKHYLRLDFRHQQVVLTESGAETPSTSYKELPDGGCELMFEQEKADKAPPWRFEQLRTFLTITRAGMTGGRLYFYDEDGKAFCDVEMKITGTPLAPY